MPVPNHSNAKEEHQQMPIIYLYVKKCNHCNLKYFGMTRRNPFTYRGSGSYWLAHNKKHKTSIETLSVWGFDNQEGCTDFALRFSYDNDIVESKDWANLVAEDGFNGGHHGAVLGPRPQEVKDKISKSNTGKKHSEETKKRLSELAKNRIVSDETRVKLGTWKEGRRSGRLGKTNSEESNKSRSEKLRGRKVSDEQKKAISEANSGRKHTEEHRKKNSLARIGKKLSEDTRKKMSESQKKRFQKHRQSLI